MIILLQNHLSCVRNSSKKTRYFPFKRVTRQGDPVWAYFFILVLETVFILLKKVKMFKACQFLIISSYTPRTLMKLLFFSQTKILQWRLYTFLNISQFFSGLKPNKSKCEIVDVGVLKGVQIVRNV